MLFGLEEAFWFGMWIDRNKGISPREYRRNLSIDNEMMSEIDNIVGEKQERIRLINEAVAQVNRGL